MKIFFVKMSLIHFHWAFFFFFGIGIEASVSLGDNSSGIAQLCLVKKYSMISV